VTAIKFSTILKWMGYATAVLSLIFGVREFVKIFSDRMETRRKVETLLKSKDVEFKVKDYQAAWRSLEEASKVDPDSAKIHSAQENVAMAWLEDVHLHEGEKFSDVSEKAEPVLSRGIASTKDQQRSADLLAHIGWAYFLRSRDGIFGLDPAGAYAKAVEQDKNNPYAESMWGHWILWNRGKLGDAQQHFAAALVTGRQREFVRMMQFAALENCPNGACDDEMIRVANDIRKENGKVDAETARRIYSNYYGRVFSLAPLKNEYINVIPPAEHVALFHWLYDELDMDSSEGNLRMCYLATLEEAAGQKEEALATYKTLRARVPKHSGSLSDAIDGGIKRLATVH
jgi:tetratricopeptide (TPR) repeat protein